MKHWLDLSHEKPWTVRDQKRVDNTHRKIHTDEYMQAGWNDCPPGAHPYVRGSRHNKIGMWIMWTYYVIIILMVTRLVWVLNT